MQIYSSSLHLKASASSWGVAIGNFDGTHLGHQTLLQTLKFQSQRMGCSSALITFEPHPREFFQTQSKKSLSAPWTRIWGPWDTRHYLKSQGISALVEQTFDDVFSQLSAAEFIRQYLVPLGLKFIVIGYDFAFGKNREGSVESLRQFASENGIQIFVIDPVLDGDQKISTTLIKQKLSIPDLEAAKKYLGRDPSLGGVVVHGKAQGRTIGVPTANIEILFRPALAHGVYAVRVHRIGQAKTYQGVSNLGLNPTVSSTMQTKFETHIFDFSEDIYGQELNVEFCKYLRSERKMKDFTELKNQIQIDIQNAKGFFK